MADSTISAGLQVEGVAEVLKALAKVDPELRKATVKRMKQAGEPMAREAIEEFWKIDCEDTRYDVEDRLNEGRGVLGIADKDLPAAIQALQK